MAALCLRLLLGLQRGGGGGGGDDTPPANALTLGGQPLTLNGEYLTLGD